MPHSPFSMGDTVQGRHRRELGAAIRKERTRRGISTRKFAAMVGVSASYLHDVETGSSSPTVDMLVRIAGGLGMEVRELIAF